MSRAAGMLVVARRFPGQARAPFRSAEEVAAARDRRVRGLVRYAVETVPYYRDLGIDPRAFRTADDLARLPLLERAVLHAAPRRFVSESRRARGAFRVQTSGTSGSPVEIFHDRVSILENIAYGERERAVEVAFTGRRFRYRIAQFMSERSSVSLVRDWYGRTSFRPFRPERHYLSLFAPYDELAAELERLRPDVVIGYGGHVEMLFRHILDRDGTVEGLSAIVYGRDRMTDEGRRLIETGLGAPVISRYASIESFKIAYACELRSGLHLHEDLCHVRLVRRDGTPAGPGETGEVVLSNLVNRGSVILNYRLGDLARLEDEPCPCGRSGRRLVDFDGRADEIVELVDGTIVHPGSVQGVLVGWDGIVRTQLVQLEPERFELRLVARDGAFARHREALAVEMSALLGGARVDVVEHETLDPPDGAKFRQIESLKRRA